MRNRYGIRALCAMLAMLLATLGCGAAAAGETGLQRDVLVLFTSGHALRR